MSEFSDEFLEMLRRRFASAAVTPSAARNMGKKGMVKVAREFLRDKIDLQKFADADAEKFADLLDAATEELRITVRAYMREGKSGWGPARKFLNLYLRDCSYSHHLRFRYRLFQIERLLEVPLDKEVMSFLVEKVKGHELRLVPVSDVDADISSRFQRAANEFAMTKNMHRADIDVFAWRRETI